MKDLVNPLNFSLGPSLNSSDIFVVSEDHNNDDNGHDNRKHIIAVEHRSPEDEPVHLGRDDFAH